MRPQKIIHRAKVPVKCNFVHKSALFPQAAPCPFSILGRTLNIVASEINTIIIMVTDIRWFEISSIIVEHVLLYY